MMGNVVCGMLLSETRGEGDERGTQVEEPHLGYSRAQAGSVLIVFLLVTSGSILLFPFYFFPTLFLFFSSSVFGADSLKLKKHFLEHHRTQAYI